MIASTSSYRSDLLRKVANNPQGNLHRGVWILMQQKNKKVADFVADSLVVCSKISNYTFLLQNLDRVHSVPKIHLPRISRFPSKKNLQHVDEPLQISSTCTVLQSVLCKLTLRVRVVEWILDMTSSESGHKHSLSQNRIWLHLWYQMQNL